MIEVPFNSPEPLKSIEAAARALAGRAEIGCGTALSVEQVEATKAAGGFLNAATIYDHTHYYAVLPASGFARGLEVHAVEPDAAMLLELESRVPAAHRHHSAAAYRPRRLVAVEAVRQGAGRLA